jgi:hypothetical protein
MAKTHGNLGSKQFSVAQTPDLRGGKGLRKGKKEEERSRREEGGRQAKEGNSWPQSSDSVSKPQNRHSAKVRLAYDYTRQL